MASLTSKLYATQMSPFQMAELHGLIHVGDPKYLTDTWYDPPYVQIW